MKKFLFPIFCVVLALIVLFPTSAFASSPPSSIVIKFNVNSNHPTIYDKSGMLFVSTGKWDLKINGDGSFTKTISIPNNNFSADQFANGAPEEGTFTLNGNYNKGNLTGEWTFELNIPARKGWNFPDSYTGKGTFYTTQPITEFSGAGVLEGEVSRSYTKWTDVNMKSTTALTETANFKDTWVTPVSCTEVICGCGELPDAADSMARFNSVTGEVSVAHCNAGEKAQDWTPATPKTKLLVGDHVSTGEESSAIFQFLDMTTFQMKPDTEVIIKSPPEQETKMGLVAGHLWINFKKMVTNGTMEVEMGQAVAGIKGTTLVLEQDDGISTLKVIEGTVVFTSKATGNSIEVNAGEQVSSNSDGLTPVQKFDIASESAAWKTLDEISKSKSSSGSALPALAVGAICAIAVLGFLVIVIAVIVFIKRKKTVK